MEVEWASIEDSRNEEETEEEWSSIEEEDEEEDESVRPDGIEGTTLFSNRGFLDRDSGTSSFSMDDFLFKSLASTKNKNIPLLFWSNSKTSY